MKIPTSSVYDDIKEKEEELAVRIICIFVSFTKSKLLQDTCKMKMDAVVRTQTSVPFLLYSGSLLLKLLSRPNARRRRSRV